MLNDMRVGTVSEPSFRLLNSLSRPIEHSDDIVPTEIFPLRRFVDACNKRHLDRLGGDLLAFHATDTFGYDVNKVKIPPSRGKEILDRIVAPVVMLKVSEIAHS